MPADPKLVAELQRLIESDQNKYTQRYIGAQVGMLMEKGTLSNSYISTYMAKGKGSTNPEFEPALREWLQAEKSQRERRWKNQFFLKNPVTEQVAIWLGYCQRYGQCVALTGDSGIGKTETLDHCLAGKKTVFRIQASPQRNQARHLVQTLCDTIGEDHPTFHMASNPADALGRFFTEYPFSIVVDDFDMLIQSAFEFLLRDLLNVTRLADRTVPIFLAGNIEGVRQLRKLSPQLASRVRHINISAADCFNKKLVREFMQHHLDGVELTDDMLKAGVELANKPDLGHLRTLFSLCQEVRDFATDEEDAEILFFDKIVEISAPSKTPVCRRGQKSVVRSQETEAAPVRTTAAAGRELVTA